MCSKNCAEVLFISITLLLLFIINIIRLMHFNYNVSTWKREKVFWAILLLVFFCLLYFFIDYRVTTITIISKKIWHFQNINISLLTILPLMPILVHIFYLSKMLELHKKAFAIIEMEVPSNDITQLEP